ncbi:DUF1837 domain-containing protein [Chryseolinea sp. T2]|uniref:HamA C-terminal domain-containing protein n=1 Tax=Chryseolinea sp. T2 TaxID=3129255 RepID=UPI003076ECB3
MELDLVNKIFEDIVRGSPTSLSNYLRTIEFSCPVDQTRTKVYIHSIHLNGNRQVRTRDFVEFVARHVIEYVIPRSMISEAKKRDEEERMSTNMTRLEFNARKLFTPLKNTGEGGEMLLFVLGEVLLRLPQLLCKMSLKTSAGVHYHGADGIHVGFSNKECIELFWGESKFHKSFDSALSSCLESIGPILKRVDGADTEDLFLLQNHLDLDNIDYTRIVKALLDKDSAEYNSLKYCGLCLVGFDDDVYSENVTEQVLSDLCTGWKQKIKEKLTAEELGSFDIHFFCLPVPDVDEFRRIFLETLGVQRA